LYYDTNSDFSSAQTVTGITDTTVTLSIPTNEYYWKVVAIGSDNEARTSTQTTWHFSFTSNVELANFTVTASGAGAVLKWETSREEKMRGFRVVRSESEEGEYKVVTPKLIRPNRESYRFIDRTVETGRTYYYKLEAVSIDGGSVFFGPLMVEMISVLPRKYDLSQNYPNPFNPQTSIHYALPVASQVELVIYNIMGHQVRKLVSGRVSAGYHRVLWDGRDDQGRDVPSGVYFYRLQAVDVGDPSNRFQSIKKMVVVK